MVKLDYYDVKILSILQTEGRITKIELARRVNLSPSPCWERLKKLEESGIIEGYGARVSLNKLSSYSVIFMEAEIGSHRATDFERFEKAINEIPEIVECWAVGGGIDYLVKFFCNDVNCYQRLVDKILQADIGLNRYSTYVVTKEIKNEPIPPLSLVSTRVTPIEK